MWHIHKDTTWIGDRTKHTDSCWEKAVFTAGASNHDIVLKGFAYNVFADFGIRVVGV